MKKNTILACAKGSGFITEYVQQESAEFAKYTGLQAYDIQSCFHDDHTGLLWFLTSDGTLRCVSESNEYLPPIMGEWTPDYFAGTTFPFDVAPTVVSLLCVHKGVVWMYMKKSASDTSPSARDCVICLLHKGSELEYLNTTPFNIVGYSVPFVTYDYWAMGFFVWNNVNNTVLYFEMVDDVISLNRTCYLPFLKDPTQGSIVITDWRRIRIHGIQASGFPSDDMQIFVSYTAVIDPITFTFASRGGAVASVYASHSDGSSGSISPVIGGGAPNDPSQTNIAIMDDGDNGLILYTLTATGVNEVIDTVFWTDREVISLVQVDLFLPSQSVSPKNDSALRSTCGRPKIFNGIDGLPTTQAHVVVYNTKLSVIQIHDNSGDITFQNIDPIRPYNDPDTSDNRNLTIVVRDPNKEPGAKKKHWGYWLKGMS